MMLQYDNASAVIAANERQIAALQGELHAIRGACVAALRYMEARGEGDTPLAWQLWGAIYQDDGSLPTEMHRRNGEPISPATGEGE